MTSTLPRRVATLAATLAAAVAAAVLPTGAAPAWAAGACPTLEDGVTVVVDFQQVGGGTVVRCAPGDPASGLAALRAAGFGYHEVASQPGFVCRIDGRPGPDAEDCADTPPAKAYWGYSYGQRGGSWSYSGSGAHVRDPAVGSVEGWAFNGDGGSTQPTVPPPPPPEPASAPNPSPSASTAPEEPPPSPSPATATSPRAGTTPASTGDEESGAATASSGAGSPPGGGTPTGADAETGDGTGDGTAATTGGSAGGAGATDDGDGSAAPATAGVTAAGSDDAGPGDGSRDPGAGEGTGARAVASASGASDREAGVPGATIAGVALILALAAAGIVTARRRRTPAAPERGDVP